MRKRHHKSCCRFVAYMYIWEEGSFLGVSLSVSVSFYKGHWMMRYLPHSERHKSVSTNCNYQVRGKTSFLTFAMKMWFFLIMTVEVAVPAVLRSPILWGTQKTKDYYYWATRTWKALHLCLPVQALSDKANCKHVLSFVGKQAWAPSHLWPHSPSERINQSRIIIIMYNSA